MTPSISMFSQGSTYSNKQFNITLPQRLPLGKNKNKKNLVEARLTIEAFPFPSCPAHCLFPPSTAFLRNKEASTKKTVIHLRTKSYEVTIHLKHLPL